ncbi:MAG: hypothetical protein ACI8PZ_004423 [Myxococcota bacterium]
MRARLWAALTSMEAATVSRLVSVVLALGTGAVLVTAMWLEPSPAGHGTHLQLGLNPCSFLSATGWPCPMCGATTTFTLMAHLRWVDGLVNQPFAASLFLLTVATFATSAAEVLLPRNRWGRLLARVEPVEGHVAVAFLGAMGLGWLYKAWLMGLV